MALYVYECPIHGHVEIRHPMIAVGLPQSCPVCKGPVRRVVTPAHHWWPSNYRPGFEDSAQRRFLDPDFQARTKDDLAKRKAEHVERESGK